MSRDNDKPVLHDIEAELDAELPADLGEPALQSLTDDLFDLVWPVGEPDLPRHVLMARLVAKAFNTGREYQRHVEDTPPTPRTDVVRAGRLLDSCRALLAGTPADGPLPPNEWHVTGRDGSVTFFAPDAKHCNTESALHLAVWLIALADPTLSNAVPMLLRVATR